MNENTVFIARGRSANCALIFAALIAVASPLGFSQSADNTEDPSTEKRGPQLEEVVVTARRTSERAQDVPIAVSAMTSDDLRRDSITSATDLNGKVPSLVISTGNTMRNVEIPTIRGQGSQFGTAPGVVLYMNEVPLATDPIANYQGGPGKFFDLANLQILKGSQGTLFGRNTTGGVMLLEPAKPHEEFALSLRAGVSHMDTEGDIDPVGYSYEAVVNVPIVEDRLMARIGGQKYSREGFTRDVATGKDYDSKGYWTARLGLLWRPTDRIENYFFASYVDSHDNGTGNVIERINREGLNKAIPSAIGAGILTTIIPGVDLSQSANAGCLLLNYYGPSSNCGQDILDEQEARSIREVQLSGDPNDIMKSGLYVDKFSYELTDALTLINIASMSTMDHVYRWDLDGSRAAFNEFTNPDDLKSADIRTYTEELQLQGTAFEDNLNFALGVYYEMTEASGAIRGRSLLFVDVDQGYEQEKDSFAQYAQGTLDLGVVSDSLAGLSLTVGVRHTNDKASGSSFIKQVVSGTYTLADSSFDAEVESDAWTYTAGLDYKSEDVMVYGKVSRGYKTGGISTISVNPDRYVFDPEYVFNYELGQKADFAIGQLPIRLNSAVYYTDYTDMQVGAPDGYVDPDNPSFIPQLGQATFNVGEAWVAGFEMDLMMPLSERLIFIGTYGYTDAEYEDFRYSYFGATPQGDCTGNDIESGGELELTCVPFRNVPKHQYSLSLRYTVPVNPAHGTIETSVTYSWVDKQYGAQTSVDDDDVEPGAWLPSYGLWNASVSWQSMFGSAISARLYGTNLTNELYRISNSNQWNLTYFQGSIYSEPRNIGLEISYEI